MILNREKAIREALTQTANDPAQYGYEIPERILNSVRDLVDPPPLGDPVLNLVYAIATFNPAAVSVALHTNHRQLNSNLIRTAVKALKAMDDEVVALEASAFAHYELRDEAVPAELPSNFNFDEWTKYREANIRVTNAGFALHSDQTNKQEPEAHKGYLAERPWLMELVLDQSPDTKQIVDRWWRLLVPALLNYLDTTDLSAKTYGVRLVTKLAQNFGDKLTYSGLVPVFEDSVEPCLSFLPPLEDAKRTKLVFGPAVLCLGALAQLSKDQGNRISRVNYVAREGCLKAFLHAYENVELTIYFFDILRVFIETYAQSLTVVHLSGIVRIFMQVMTDPFIDSSPQLIDAACRAMTSTIKWAWPRIDTYKYSILLGLTKANALDSECFELLEVSRDERDQLKQKAARIQET